MELHEFERLSEAEQQLVTQKALTDHSWQRVTDDESEPLLAMRSASQTRPSERLEDSDGPD